MIQLSLAAFTFMGIIASLWSVLQAPVYSVDTIVMVTGLVLMPVPLLMSFWATMEVLMYHQEGSFQCARWSDVSYHMDNR